MPASRPNIVFILADDLGWADLSVYGQTDVPERSVREVVAPLARVPQTL